MASDSTTTFATDFQQLHQDAINAHGSKTPVVVAGAEIINPTIPTSVTSAFLTDLTKEHPEADKPDDRLVLTGQSKLFGREDLLVEFFSYHGPAPNGELKTEDGEPVVYQIAAFDRGKETALTELLPNCKGTPFDAVALKNVQFVNQNTKVDDKKGLGMTLEAEICFDQSYGQVHQVLGKVLGISDPTLHVTCGLGVQDWHKPLSVSAFVLNGEFANQKPTSSIKMLEVHKVGVHLDGNKGDDGKMTFAYTIFGELSLSLIPIPLSFEISKSGDSVSLKLTMEGDWEHAFRIPNLKIEHLILSTTFNPQDVKTTLDFEVDALLDIGTDTISFHGHYSADGYSLEAVFTHFDFSGLDGLFGHMYSTNLVKPGPKIEFGSTTLSINGNQDGTDLDLDIHEFSVDGHSVSEVKAALGSKGVTFDVIFAGDVTYDCGGHKAKIENAEAVVEFVADKKNEDGTITKGTTDILIKGTLEWESRRFSAGLHLYSGPKGETEYTVLAQFDDSNGGLALSRIIPALAKTPLNEVALQSAGLAIASRSDPQLGNLGVPCELVQGFQVYAVLGDVKQVKSVMKNSEQLVLRASWDGRFSDELDILCHAPHIDFGKGIVAKEIDIGIKGILHGNPELYIKSGLLIPVNHQPNPLEFDMSLTLGVEDATLDGELVCKDGWVDPFGVYEKLVINSVGLEIGINYELFPVQGPDCIGFNGSFGIDEVSADIAFRVEDDPTKELLKAEVQNLTLAHVTHFTSTLTKLPLPTPPDVVVFKDINIYLTPTGTTFEDVQYPPGLSFNADVVLFGIEGKAMVQIGKSGFACSGSVTPFTIGPLSVSGTTPGTPAVLDICLTEDRHYGHIDGSVSIFGSTSAISLNFEMHPTVTFDFWFMLKFAEIYDLKVEAKKAMAVSPSNPNATVGDYTLSAEFHQEMRDHVAQKINDLFKEKARLEAQEAAEREREIEAERKKLQDRIDAEQANVEKALKAKTDAINKKKEDYNKQLDAKKAEEQQKLAAFNQAQVDLKAKTDAAKNDVAARTAQATKSVTNAQQKLDNDRKSWDAKISDMHRAVDDASRKLQNTFNNAQNSIRAAQDKVNSLNNSINDVEAHIQRCKNAHWYDLPSKAAIPGLELEKVGLIAAKGVATLALTVANDFLKAADYVSADLAVKVANKALSEGQAAGDLAIKALEKELDLAKVALKGLDGALEKALDDVNKVCGAAIALAKKELEVVQNVVIGLEKDLESVETTLVSSAEFVAYKTAEAALSVAKASGTAALTLADAGVVVYNAVDQELLQVWDVILTDITKLVDITDVVITGELGKAVKDGFAFDAKVSGTFNGDKQWSFELQYDHNAVERFFKELFDKLVKLVEDGVINPVKKLVNTVEGGSNKGGAVEVSYGPNGTYTIKHA